MDGYSTPSSPLTALLGEILGRRRRKQKAKRAIRKLRQRARANATINSLRAASDVAELQRGGLPVPALNPIGPAIDQPAEPPMPTQEEARMSPAEEIEAMQVDQIAQDETETDKGDTMGLEAILGALEQRGHGREAILGAIARRRSLKGNFDLSVSGLSVPGFAKKLAMEAAARAASQATGGAITPEQIKGGAKIVAAAKAGNPKAKAAVTKIATAAKAGDPNAKKALKTLQVANKVDQIATAKAARTAPPPAGGSLYNQGSALSVARYGR